MNDCAVGKPFSSLGYARRCSTGMIRKDLLDVETIAADWGLGRLELGVVTKFFALAIGLVPDSHLNLLARAKADHERVRSWEPGTEFIAVIAGSRGIGRSGRAAVASVAHERRYGVTSTVATIEAADI